MKRYYVITQYLIALVVTILSSPLVSARTVSPETITHVTLSNRDMNRIICESGDINQIYYSQDKWAKTETQGRNAFIKFQYTDDGIDQQYANVRNEFYIVCNGDVYTIMAHPKGTPGKTIRLVAGPSDKIKASVQRFGAMSEEKRAIELTHIAYADQDVEGVTRQIFDVGKREIIRGLSPLYELHRSKQWRMEGLDLQVSEFLIVARSATTVTEHDFLSPMIAKDIFSVTLTAHSLTPKIVSRLLVVHRGES